MTAETHPTDEQIALFVMRAYDQIGFDAIEDHFEHCDACADRLAAEAEVEMSMIALAAATDWCPRCGVAAETTCMRCGIALRPGGYVVEAVLSEYGQGRTYQGRAPDGSPVRISELEFRHVRDHSVVESFVKEATLLAQLDHPLVPKLVDSFQEGDDEHLRLYAVEAWVDGTPLDEVLENHRFDETEARYIAEQVLDVLAYLQGLSPAIFHRDVRPQNLLWREDGTVFLRQFANARDMSVTGAFTLAGHTGYIPAEQHLGVVDATSDLYGLGATLAHLLTRRAPLPGDPGLERANVSDEFAAWLNRLLATHPRDRFPSAREARDALFGAPVPRRKPKLPWLALAAAFVGSVALASGTIFWLRQPEEPPPPPPKPDVRPYGTLILESSPRGARIFVDDVWKRDAETPADLSGLEMGRTYRVRMELEGHVPYESKKTMSTDLDGTIVYHTFVPLEPETKPAPPPPPPKTKVAPKPTAPPTSLPDTTASSTPAAAPPPRTDGCRVNLDASPGYVTINTTPYSDLYWGKRRLGQTPIARLQLPAGCVRLRAVSLDGSMTRVVQIVVESNEVAIYRFNLKE